ncbi:MAG: GNAT family N-acetyltransferase [Muribaculaceae bacterium]|nr:GNAT family N-acetyltransferase [Muribaculaceae bacterium]
MEIRNLSHIDFDSLFRAFEDAFCDYAIHFEKEEVRSMLARRGYEPRLSFAAFVEDRIVAFTLNGIGLFNGIPTAYDTGTGTVKEFRGQGIPGKIFDYSLPFLKQAGVKQYLLEVLKNNRTAIDIYRRMQIETVREFDCFRQNIDGICNLDTTGHALGISMEPIDSAAVCASASFCDFLPSWQNSVESIERGRKGLSCVGAFLSGKLVGYCVSDSATGDITQIAVKKDCRRRGIATLLLRHAISRMETGCIKVLNIPSENVSMRAFLESKNISMASAQYEMLLLLTTDEDI